MKSKVRLMVASTVAKQGRAFVTFLRNNKKKKSKNEAEIYYFVTPMAGLAGCPKIAMRFYAIAFKIAIR